MDILVQRLEPVLASIPVARWLTVRGCERWGLDGARGPAAQVVTELVGNAVRHAGTPIVLGLMPLHRAYLLIAVHDGCELLPRRVRSTPDTYRGRGLQIVDEFAYSFGAMPVDGGKVVWATIAAR